MIIAKCKKAFGFSVRCKSDACSMCRDDQLPLSQEQVKVLVNCGQIETQLLSARLHRPEE
jgi:hypothetical protein